MRVTQCHRQRIGGIFLWTTREIEQHADHVLHLFLGGIALAYHGLFDLARGIFRHGHVERDPGANCRTTRLPQLQCRVGIAMQENALNREHIGGVLRNDITKLAENCAQALPPVITGDTNTATSDIATTRGIMIDDAEAGDP